MSDRGWWPEPARRLPGPSAPRARGRRPFGASWWGRAWVDALEGRARLDPNRLPRGRTYARTGAVGALALKPGRVDAAVQGSRTQPYQVSVRIRAFTDDEWDRVLGRLVAEIGHLAALLDGELSPAVADDVRAAGLDLLPGPGDLQTRCTCPDRAEPCKHAAAVCYLVADALDEDPFGLLRMRGLSRAEVLAGLRDRRRPPAPAAPPADPGGVDPTPDPGVRARDLWARTPAAVPGQGDAPRHPGSPVVAGTEAPPDPGVDLERLRVNAADAARRAWELLRGATSTGIELTADEDLARRAALVLDDGDRLRALARWAGVPPRQVLRLALAWHDGGVPGVAALQSWWDPPPGATEPGRRLLGAAAAVRRNRVSSGGAQLRLGQDGLWYPFRRARSGGWDPDGPPVAVEPDDLDRA